MRRVTWRTIAVGVCLLGCLPLARAGDDEGKTKKKEIAWAKSYDDAVAKAKKDKKLIMIDFWTDWCGWCKKLDQDTYSSPKVIAPAEERFVAVKLDAEHDGLAVAKKYEINGFPTILFLDPAVLSKVDEKPASGEIAGKIVGYEPAEKFAADMKRIDASFREFPKLVEKLKADPSNVEVLGKLSVLYHEREDDKKAIDLLAKAEEKDPKNAKDLLTKAYNAVGDIYQAEAVKVVQGGDIKGRDELLSKAVALFEKAAKTGKDPDDVYYGKSSIAACRLMRNQIKEGAAELAEAVKIPGISAANKEQGEQMLDQIKAFLKQSESKKSDNK